MVDALAERIAITLKKTAPAETKSVDIMKYGLIVLMNGLSVIVLSLTVGWLMGNFRETLITLVSFIILRQLVGGFHFKSAIICIISSTTMLVVLPLIPLNQELTGILTLLSMFIISIYAPSNIEKQTRIPAQYHYILKILAVILVSSNLFFASPLLAKSFFSLSILTIQLRRNTNEKST